MTSLFSLFCSSLRKFHDNEDGMETLQVVMILGIGAVVAVALFTFGRTIWDWVVDKVNEVIKGESYKTK